VLYYADHSLAFERFDYSQIGSYIFQQARTGKHSCLHVYLYVHIGAEREQRYT